MPSVKASNFHCSWGVYFCWVLSARKYPDNRVVWWHCISCPVSNPQCKYLFHLPWWTQQNSDHLTKVLLPTRATADLLCCCPVINHRTRLATHAFYTIGCITLLNGGIAPKLQLKRSLTTTVISRRMGWAFGEMLTWPLRKRLRDAFEHMWTMTGHHTISGLPWLQGQRWSLQQQPECRVMRWQTELSSRM